MQIYCDAYHTRTLWWERSLLHICVYNGSIEIIAFEYGNTERVK